MDEYETTKEVEIDGKTNYVGLFGYVMSASIKNIKIMIVLISGLCL